MLAAASRTSVRAVTAADELLVCTAARAAGQQRARYATEAPQRPRESTRPVIESFGSSSTHAKPDDRLSPIGYGVRAPAAVGPSTLSNEARFAALEPQLASDLATVVRTFRAPIRYAFSYGSGVFKQTGYRPEDKPLLDFVFAVSTPVHWHDLNISQHPQHYSLFARLAGSRFVSIVQERIGARCWFNVECEVNGRLIKYGVISIDDLCHDLLDWETLYMSGRMHKPIRVLRDDPRVRLADQVNLGHAVRTSLLLLPETFTEAELYRMITGLSYRGDFRMSVGENPAKVSNIVSAQFDRFQALYSPVLGGLKSQGALDWSAASGDRLQQDFSPRARAQLARKLPTGLRTKLEGHFEGTRRIAEAVARANGNEVAAGVTSTNELAEWTKIVQDPAFNGTMLRCLESLVAGPALTQSLKGIVSVGLSKGIRYVGPKLRKRWAGKPKA